MSVRAVQKLNENPKKGAYLILVAAYVILAVAKKEVVFKQYTD